MNTHKRLILVKSTDLTNWINNMDGITTNSVDFTRIRNKHLTRKLIHVLPRGMCKGFLQSMRNYK